MLDHENSNYALSYDFKLIDCQIDEEHLDNILQEAVIHIGVRKYLVELSPNRRGDLIPCSWKNSNTNQVRLNLLFHSFFDAVILCE